MVAVASSTRQILQPRTAALAKMATALLILDEAREVEYVMARLRNATRGMRSRPYSAHSTPFIASNDPAARHHALIDR